ncbi:MAG: hypothetical protein JNN15_10825, partial [Blastocatellia bacterium]|nr:hypothetical protein [Blastocatellia bacterium]
PGLATSATFESLEKLGTLLRESLDSPNIIADYTKLELEDGRLLLLSSLCSGILLEDLVANRNLFSTETIIDILLQIGSILSQAHKTGFIHGAMTPETVL